MSAAVRMPLAEAMRRGLIGETWCEPRWREQYDFALVPLAALGHIETATNAKRLRRLRAEWEPARAEPIELMDGDGGRFVLINGQHRLRLARERGDEAIAAVIRRPSD